MKKNFLCILLSLLVVMTGIFIYVPSDTAFAGSTSSIITQTNITYPQHLLKGGSFALSGKLTASSSARMTKIRVGVANSKGTKWVSGHYRTSSLNKVRSYSLSGMTRYSNFKTLSAGSYRYKIQVWMSFGSTTKSWAKSWAFTVSDISLTGAKYPTSLTAKKSASISGTIHSTFSLSKVYAGVRYLNGTAVSGCYASASPQSTSYSLSKLSSKINFDRLNAGSYYYVVSAVDKYGISKVLKKTKLTVVKPAVAKLSGVTYPKHLLKGKDVALKGTVTAASGKLDSVTAGVMTTSGKWIKGYYSSVNPKAKTYSLSTVDKKVPINKLTSGTYYYAVRVSVTGDKSAQVLLKKRFTISYIEPYKAVGPSKITKGSSYSLSGYVKSRFSLPYLRIGIRNYRGAWKSGFFKTTSSKTRSYNISNVDSAIKFGKLAVGTYYYTIEARDYYGVEKTVVNKKFIVYKPSTTTQNSSSANSSDGTTLRSNGRVLSYKSSVISAIGAQPYSGPCGIYAMAYARAVIDGYFSKNGYSSYYARIIAEYGFGTSLAYWYRAGGSSCYYSSARSAYRTALKQIAKGRPAIINVRSGYTGNQHYVTVIGYTAGTTYSNVSLSNFIVLDPAYGAKKYLRYMKYYNNSSPQCITF